MFPHCVVQLLLTYTDYVVVLSQESHSRDYWNQRRALTNYFVRCVQKVQHCGREPFIYYTLALRNEQCGLTMYKFYITW